VCCSTIDSIVAHHRLCVRGQLRYFLGTLATVKESIGVLKRLWIS
jgi:hypothetical protein